MFEQRKTINLYLVKQYSACLGTLIYVSKRSQR